MKNIPVIVFVAFGFVFSSTTILAQGSALLARANQYAIVLQRYQNQKNRVSVEKVVNKGKFVAEKLGDIEDLSDADYSLLKRKMKGFTINRQEILFIEPESKFFLKLARRKGVTADVAYFSLMQKLKPNDVWVAYNEQQTDVTGCTIYGKGILTGLYGKLLDYSRNYPRSYVTSIKEEKAGIIESFSEGGCSCGDINSVLKEFRLFIKTYPHDSNTPRIRLNLTKIKKNGDFRPNCHSG